MKISTKSRYGLRAMIDMAAFSGEDHLPLNKIAESQDVSVNYLEQVFSALRKAGLVKSIKGAQGGYLLADDPEKISIGRILRVLEGDLSIVDEDVAERDFDKDINCVISEHVWKKVNAKINSTVDSIYLKDLANELVMKKADPKNMYYI